MADLTLAAGDLQPPLVVTLMDRNAFPPAPVDLTGATGVDILWRSVDGTTDVVRAAAIVAPRVDGLVSYQWVTGDTATPGRRWVAFVVHFPAGNATYAGFDVVVTDPVPAATSAALVSVRHLIGTSVPPSDAEVARALSAASGHVNATALGFLRSRLASLLAAPLKRTDPGDGVSYDYTANAKMLEDQIARIEAAEETDTGDDPAGNRIRVHSITRSDHYRDATVPVAYGWPGVWGRR